MAFNEQLADRIREVLADSQEVQEKQMFGGLCYMVKGKMCVGVVGDELMCRINPDKQEEYLELEGARPMDFTGKPMKGYLFISPDGLKKEKDLRFWIHACMEFNSIAKAAKKRASKRAK